MSGQVTDQQNAALVGAEVKMFDASTNATLTTNTNESGRYVFVNVPSGTFDITFTKQGFVMYKVSSQPVTVGTVLTVNASLKVGATTTTIEVSASAGAELQTTNATVGSTLTSDALKLLPNLGRDVSTLAVLQPGTTPGGHTAGAFQDQNVYMLDGGNNSDDMAGNNTSYVTNFTGTGGTQTGGSSSGVMPTPVESIEEFRVSTFNQTADFSGSIGGQIQMVTKRGTTSYHGSAYMYYYATNVGAANSWTNNHTPAAGLPYTPLPSNHRNRFGGSLGGILLPKMLGGKTFFFVNYEGSRFPNVAPYERTVPSDLLRAGVIQVADASGKFQPYNLNTVPVTVNGVTYSPATCGGGACDPRGIGLNPTIKQLWDKTMPRANEFVNQGDLYNTQGYLSTIRSPLTQNSYVARIDHDFGEKNRFFATYRYMTLTNLTTNQVDIGGVLPGATFGTPAAIAPRVQLPSYWVVGLTTNIRPTVTNDFRFNYTRNFWQWGSANAPPQLPGLGGAIEIGGESANALIPYNVNTQNTRQRFWDGQDKLIRDDVTIIKGSHLLQIGGLYQRNYDYHMRTDNGQGINNQIVYQVTASNTSFANFQYPSTVPTTQQSNWNTNYAYALGLVAQSQVVYTRSGQDLHLGPVGQVATDQSIVPYYNIYFADTWHMKPSITVSYGLSYTVEMPPYELNAKQVEMTYQDGTPVIAEDYLQKRQAAALAGGVYNPILGYATVNNVAGHPKYPYDPFYGGLSPRVSVAWNPRFTEGILGKLLGDNKTVIRGGYGRIYGRLNGVNLLLVPLLPPGLLQAVSCPGVSKTGQCMGSGGVDPSTVFRIGVDGNSVPLPAVGNTLPQPYIPGVSGAGASDVTSLDPHYRPERTDNVTVTIQRQLSKTQSFEIGYVGRIIRNELLARNLDSVPYMTTLGGQSFADAFGKTFFNVPTSGALTAAGYSTAAQPFFENAMGGAGSAYCAGFANCTSAVVVNNTNAFRNTAVSDLWNSLSKAATWKLGRTLLSQNLGGTPSQGYTYILNTGDGYGNYNALFLSHHMRDWKGITVNSNFTWGKALGTGNTSQATSSNTALDVYNLQNNYGLQSYDLKFIYNTAMFWQPKWYRSQKGVVGRILGGWTFSPLFTAQSGAALNTAGVESGSSTGQQAFGEVSTASSATTSFTTNAAGITPYTGGSSAHYNVPGSAGVGTSNPTGVNIFADPAAVLAEFRKCVLGFDANCGGFALRGLPRWNVDLAVGKGINFWKEGIGADLSIQFTNVLNHAAMGTPTLTTTSPSSFGRITGTASTARQMEFGLRLHF